MQMDWLKTFWNAVSWAADYAVYAAIVLVFVLGIVKCIAPVASNKGMLRRGIRLLRDGVSRNAWQEDRFLGKGSLMPHWTEYLNNLFFADGAYHNASSVEDYINEDTVIYGPGRAAFADAIPGLLVSLGFMGTLIGLANGLAGFNMESSAAVQESILTLVPGMRYAFMTSIAGVVASVAFTLVLRATNGSTERVIREFYSALNRVAGVESVEPLTQIAIYQQEQTALIQTMAKDLNGKFTEKLADIMDGAVEPLTRAMKDFVTVSTKEQMRFLDAVAQRFVDRMDGALSGQLNHLGEVLEAVAKREEAAFRTVDESMRVVTGVVDEAREMKQSLEGFKSAFDGYLASANDAAQAQNDAVSQVEANLEKMNIVSSQQSRYLAEAGKFTARLEEAVKTLETGLERISRESSARDGEILDRMEEAVDALRGAAQEYAELGERFSARAEEEMRLAIGDVRRESDEAQDKAIREMELVSHAAVDAVARAAQNMAREADELSVAVERASRAILDATDRIAGDSAK